MLIEILHDSVAIYYKTTRMLCPLSFSRWLVPIAHFRIALQFLWTKASGRGWVHSYILTLSLDLKPLFTGTGAQFGNGLLFYYPQLRRRKMPVYTEFEMQSRDTYPKVYLRLIWEKYRSHLVWKAHATLGEVCDLPVHHLSCETNKVDLAALTLVVV